MFIAVNEPLLSQEAKDNVTDAVATGCPQCREGVGQAIDPCLGLTKRDDPLVLKPGGPLRPAPGRAREEMSNVHESLRQCTPPHGRGHGSMPF